MLKERKGTLQRKSYLSPKFNEFFSVYKQVLTKAFEKRKPKAGLRLISEAKQLLKFIKNGCY